MNTTRRQVIKTTGVLGTLVSLGIITQAQASRKEAIVRLFNSGLFGPCP